MSDKLVRVVTKLNRETQEGKLKWIISELPVKSLSGTESLIDKAYTTEVDGKRMRLYRFNDRFYTDYEEYVKQDYIRLEFIDKNDNSEWIFPSYVSSSIYDLYESVRYKVANVDGFIEKFLEGYTDNDEKDEDLLALFK
ncbi:MAG: hypothetical protein MUE85_22585 [Microscillaceae bacterium]|jgi:hypothetical protein|nr:hypothetical protein [Microscillaceae bacterium]